MKKNQELRNILESIRLNKDQTYTKELEINMRKFYFNPDKYYKSYDKLKDNVGKISSETFNKELYNYIYEHFFGQKYENNFIENLKDEYPLRKFHIFNEIYNLYWKDEIDLGTHILHSSVIKVKDKILSVAKKENTIIKFNEKNSFWIETVVDARDNKAALEIGKMQNEEFLDALSFVLYSSTELFYKFLVTIGYEISYSNFYNFSATEGTIFELENELLEYKISKKLDSVEKIEMLKKLLKLDKTKFLEKKIKNSLRWFREAMQEKNEVTSFLKMMISLESLLSFQEENFMTPSISHGISENVALILEKTVEKRTELYNILKELYSFRSAIVHNGNFSKINYSTKIKLSNIVVALILELVRNEKYKNIIGQESYIKYFREIKFS